MDRENECQDNARELLDAVRGNVAAALEAGANPTHLAATLVYVATEMWLQLAPIAVAAFQTLLEPMALATKAHLSRERSATTKDAISGVAVPSLGTLH